MSGSGGETGRAAEVRAATPSPLLAVLNLAPIISGVVRAAIDNSGDVLRGSGLQDAPDRFLDKIQRVASLRQAAIDYLGDAGAASPMSAKLPFYEVMSRFYRMVQAMHLIVLSDIEALDITVRMVRRGVITRDMLVGSGPVSADCEGATKPCDVG